MWLPGVTVRAREHYEETFSVLSTLKRNPIFLAIAAVVLIAVLWFAWWTISPLFVRTSLVEGQDINVPAASAPAQDGAMVDEPAEMMGESAGASMQDKAEMAKPEEKKMYEESGGTAATTPEASTMLDDKAEDDMTEGASEGAMAGTDKPMEEPIGPMVLSVGSFDRKDDVHYASGQAILAREADGTYVVRLQDLDAANGPDLYVYVSEHPNPANSDELHQGGHNVGTLKATNGSFSYTLAPEIDPAKVKSVVIYCRAFSVIFSTASLQMQ
jgi:hypothetical protein